MRTVEEILEELEHQLTMHESDRWSTEFLIEWIKDKDNNDY